jgi:hypothetical protein
MDDIEKMQQKLEQLIDWKDGHNLSDMSAKINRVVRLVDGDTTIGYDGIRAQLVSIQASINRIESAERERLITQKALADAQDAQAKKFDQSINQFKILSSLIGAAVGIGNLPRIVELVQLVFRP